MMRLKQILSVLLIISGLFSILSCDKRPKLRISENEAYYSYVNLEYGRDERHYLDLVIPKSDVVHKGMKLYIHGGGWIGGDKEVYADHLKRDAERGYVAAAVNYRYANGKSVTCEDILDDIELALKTVKETCKEYGVDLDKVMLLGGSAGAHLSLMFAYTRAETSLLKPVAVASYAGPTNLKDENFYATQHVDDIKKMISRISGTDLQKKSVDEFTQELDIASPLYYASDGAVPTLIFHGMKDDVVPYSNALDLYDALTELEIHTELVTFENSGHGLEADPERSEYAEGLVLEFMDAYLK